MLSSTPQRIAEDPEQLRHVLAGTWLAPILPALRLEPYFPRSADRLIAEERRSRLASHALFALAGVLLATGGVSIWRVSPWPFSYTVLAAVPMLVVLRRLMGNIFGSTSQSQRFIELLCFDRRELVVYLRRFEGEDPVLPALTTRNAVVGSATNPAGTDTLENLAQVLEVVGPVVGLGRPTDTGIAHRIYRLYTPDQHWQSVVHHLLGRARAVLMSYEPGPILDWELDQVLASERTILFLLLRRLPESVVREEATALAALPRQIGRLGRPCRHVDAVSATHLGDEHGLLVVVVPGEVRVYGVKMHFRQLWDIMFEEIVHKQRLTQAPPPQPKPQPVPGPEAPAVYRPLVRAVSGGAGWATLIAFASGVAAVVIAAAIA